MLVVVVGSLMYVLGTNRLLKDVIEGASVLSGIFGPPRTYVYQYMLSMTRLKLIWTKSSGIFVVNKLPRALVGHPHIETLHLRCILTCHKVYGRK